MAMRFCSRFPWCALGLALWLPAGEQKAATRAVTDGRITEARVAEGGVAQGGMAEDREAFRVARATVDPEQRLAALRQFANRYPESALGPRATELALETTLQNFPERTAQVHELAARQIADAPAGLERVLEQARVADMLAEAEPAGADLSAAQGWAETALAALTEESFRRETVATQRQYKLPPLSGREVHRSFLRNRVLCLAALASVELRQGEPAQADPLLAEAFRLNPLSSEVNALRGQVALDRHEDGAALESFKRAEATGALGARWRAQALGLYIANKGIGGEAGLDSEVDALYAKLMPPVFTLHKRTLPATGHTVLLELFTGAGCEPCVAPDLAVESLLATYRRQDLAVLEYDENIPRPDPLTSPASEVRALMYRVGSTPEAFLDGEPLPIAGSARGDVENVVIGFASELEDEAAQPSPLRLALEGKQTSGTLTAQARISLPPGVAAASLPGRVVVHVALVQDGMRYSGENGVRFHRMVVRAMGEDTALRLAGGPSTGAGAPAQTVEARFDLGRVESTLRSYLDAYEHRNDRFGEVHFRTKDLPLDPAQLGMVVWVQDLATRSVLQAAYLPVPASGQGVR